MESELQRAVQILLDATEVFDANVNPVEFTDLPLPKQEQAYSDLSIARQVAHTLMVRGHCTCSVYKFPHKATKLCPGGRTL